ncbi:uncharacterized protein LOC120708743 isoform X4 [Panicum virgatum]|uniref:uncharacterized protein LOC120708743 isoform X4 n=1 Tax=Panicum virgatum TaxID=38727 RepID=UPI0019D4EFC5|nr:uncharacterized protein LOC120708743 isoform X4 [Panicum virgatum]
MKPSGTLQNIRLQTPRHRSLFDRRVEGANQVPRRSIDKAAPKVNEGKDEVNEQNWQMHTMSSHVSSVRDWNFEFDVAFEGRNHSAHPVKPSAMLRNIRVQMPRHPSLLDRTDNYHQHVGAFNAINERRLPKAILFHRIKQ